MSIVLANAKKAKLLDQQRTFLNACKVRLFSNNATVNGAITSASFTEPTDSGYAAQAPVFAAATLNGSNQGQTLAPTLTFTINHNAGDVTIWGYYVTDDADDEPVYAEKRSAAVVLTQAGDSYTVTPKALLDTMP